MSANPANSDQPASVPDVLRRLLADDPGRPRVTWYGPDHERVELSAKTLGNWVSKTSNLLVDELDAGPGVRVGLALPAHWRTVVWLLAGWNVGADLVVFEEEPPGRADASGSPLPPSTRLGVLVTDRPSNPPAGTQESLLVVVPLPALATRFTGDVPSGALDAATEVRLQPDHFPGSEPPSPEDPAFTVAGGKPVEYGELIALARTAVPAQPVRLLTGSGPADAVGSYLGPLAAGGSVVIHHDLAGLTTAQRDHLVKQEGVTLLG